MSNPQIQTNFLDNNGIDLGSKLITQDYLMSAYPQIASWLISPELYGAGYNGNNLLGIPGSNNYYFPTQVSGNSWKQVSSGYYHGAAVKTDGSLWTWGYNNYGELGVGDNTSRSTPSFVSSGWKQVACGLYNTIAIKNDGTLYSWGSNIYGESGRGGSNTCIPGQIGSSNDWNFVSASNDPYEYTNCAAIKNNGDLYAWGRNNYGQLGNATTTAVSFPSYISGSWKQISCGSGHNLGIKVDGTLWGSGQNGYGQIGNNSTSDSTVYRQEYFNATNWKQGSTALFSSAAIKTDGTLWTWGSNRQGFLGTGSFSSGSSAIPNQIYGGGTLWKYVSCGRYHAVAIKMDGTLWNWANNLDGQLADGTTSLKCIPQQIFLGSNNWKSVSCAAFSTMMLKARDNLQGI